MASNRLFFDEDNSPFTNALGFNQLQQALAEEQQRQDPFSSPLSPQQAQQAVAPNAMGAGGQFGLQGPPTLPMGGQQQPMQQPMPQQGGGFGPPLPNLDNRGQTRVGRMLNSPGMAMASAALNNLGSGGRGPQQDAIGAYQQGVQRQALLKQQENVANLRAAQEERLQGSEARAAEKFERNKNPLADFEAFIERRPELAGADYDTQLAAWQTFQRSNLKGASETSQMKNTAQRMRMQASIDSGDGQYSQGDLDAFNEDVRKTQWLNTGNAFVNPGASGPSGDIPISVKPGEELDYLNERNSNKILTESLAKNNSEILNAIGTPYDEATTMLQNTRELRQQIESGEFQRTGVFEGPLAKMMGDPEAARLQAKAVMMALKNLQITNLAPVTENELALIQELYAGISSDPLQNVEILKESEKLLQQKLDQIDKLATYYANNNDSLEGYGMGRYRKSPEAPAGGDASEDKVINLVIKDGKLVQE